MVFIRIFFSSKKSWKAVTSLLLCLNMNRAICYWNGHQKSPELQRTCVESLRKAFWPPVLNSIFPGLDDLWCTPLYLPPQADANVDWKKNWAITNRGFLCLRESYREKLKGEAVRNRKNLVRLAWPDQVVRNWTFEIRLETKSLFSFL